MREDHVAGDGEAARSGSAGSQISPSLLWAVMDDATDAIFVKDFEGRFLLFNRAAAQAVGLPSAQVMGKTIKELFGPTAGGAIRAIELQVMETGQPVTREETIETASGPRIFLATRSPYRDESGGIVGVIGISRDITERRQAEQALHDSEVRWQFAVDGAGDGIWDWDVRSDRVFYSHQWKAMLGYTDDEVGDTTEDWSQRIHPDDLDRCWKTIEDHFKDNAPFFTLEHRMRAKDGSWRWILDRGKVVERAQDGSPLRVIGTHTDITDRKLVEQDLRLERERLQLAADVSGIGVWEYEMEANTLRCDDACHHIFGLDPAVRRVKSMGAFKAIVHPDDVHKMTPDRLAEIVTRTKDRHIDFRIVRPSGEIRWVTSAACLQKATPLTPSHFVGIVTDITEKRLAEEQLIKAKEAAEAGERAKADFMATMSHEIRTPMNTVIGMTRLVQQTDLSPRQRNYLEKIDISAKALLGIINDVLDYSKIEAGMLALEDTEFELDEVLETVSAVTAMRAEEKGLEIAYRVASNIPQRLRGDPLRLGQVLINLVGNAVKFTETGEIVVNVENRPGNGGDAVLSFSVRDTGIGIDEDKIGHLFKPFTQAETQTSRRYGGTGLGLAICRELVELMGGEIAVNSKSGVGSEFHFTIKARQALSAQAVSTNGLQRTALMGTQVLIVDDNASAREILTDMVQMFGMKAEAVASGEEGLKALRKRSAMGAPFEIVLTDWRMPGMDGLEVARRIREEERLSKTPAVLMVTAFGREEVLQRVEQLGLQGLLIKPITESVMFNTLIEILGPKLLLNETSPATPGIRIDPRAALAGRKILVVDDNALNREVATDFLELVGVHVTTAVNGREALAALEVASFDAVLMDIHMPVMDGLEATRMIRQRPQWSNLPIIALTAQARSEDHAIVAAAGMNGHLTKPIDENKLYDVLAGFVTERDQPEETMPAAAMDTLAAEIKLRLIDIPAMITRFRGRSEFVSRLLAGFARDFASTPDDVERLVKFNQPADLALLLHTLRGAVGYLGATTIAGDADRLERAAREGNRNAMRELAPPFVGKLRDMLLEIDAMTGAMIDGAELQGEDLASVRILIDQLRPLIENADYGAVKIFDQLALHLRAPPFKNVLNEARQGFDDLDQDVALAALNRLAAGIGESRLGQ